MLSTTLTDISGKLVTKLLEISINERSNVQNKCASASVGRNYSSSKPKDISILERSVMLQLYDVQIQRKEYCI